MIEICIKDTGIGISEEDKPKLFRLFGTVKSENNSSQNTSGIGLGLFMARKLVEQFCGKIDVES